MIEEPKGRFWRTANVVVEIIARSRISDLNHAKLGAVAEAEAGKVMTATKPEEHQCRNKSNGNGQDNDWLRFHETRAEAANDHKLSDTRRCSA